MISQEIFDKWIEALESGQYEQGTECLKWSTDNACSYCCLGVLAEVMGLQWDNSKYSKYKFGVDGDINYISDNILPLGVQQELAKLNDIQGMSFLEIAEVLKENPGLYVQSD